MDRPAAVISAAKVRGSNRRFFMTREPSSSDWRRYRRSRTAGVLLAELFPVSSRCGRRRGEAACRALFAIQVLLVLSPSDGGCVPLLIGAAGAGPDLQAGAVGGAAPGRVETFVGGVVHDVLGRGDGPFLGARAVAVIELDLGAVGRRRRGDV